MTWTLPGSRVPATELRIGDAVHVPRSGVMFNGGPFSIPARVDVVIAVDDTTFTLRTAEGHTYPARRTPCLNTRGRDANIRYRVNDHVKNTEDPWQHTHSS